MTQIVKGTLIGWFVPDDLGEGKPEPRPPVIERVLFLDASAVSAVVINTDENDTLLPFTRTVEEIQDALAREVAFHCLTDPHAWFADPDEDFLNAHIQSRDRAWECIKGIVHIEPQIYSAVERGRLVRAAAEASGVERCEVYKFLRRWWKRGMHIHTLLPSYRNCGAPGKIREVDEDAGKAAKRGRPPKVLRVNPDLIGVNVTPTIKAKMLCGYEKFFRNNPKAGLEDAFEKMNAAYFKVGFRADVKDNIPKPVLLPSHQRPTLEQFKYWTREDRISTGTLIKREGQSKYNLKYRPTLGNSTQMASGPGAIYQIDATIGDVYLVSSLNRANIIGRPIIYMVVDVFSRMVVGLYVGLEGPSWAGAMMAIVNATSDKVEFCRKHGINITQEEFPCTFLCDMWLADRGEMLCHDSDKLTARLNMRVANCPPYRGDFKGIVERTFGRVNEKVLKWTPGEVRKREPGGKGDYRLDAKLTIKDLTTMLLHMILHYNNYHYMEWYPQDRDQIAANVAPIPLELWNWGIANRSGYLREKSPDIIKAALLPSDKATVTESGIKFNNLFYTCDRAKEEDWFARASARGTWHIDISHDKRSNNIIYYRNGGGLEPCILTDVENRFLDSRHEEVQDYFEAKDINLKLHNSSESQSKADLNSSLDYIIKNATEATNQALAEQDISKPQRVRSIKGNRSEEKEWKRQNEAFIIGEKPETRKLPAGDGRVPAEDPLESTLASKKQNIMDMLINR